MSHILRKFGVDWSSQLGELHVDRLILHYDGLWKSGFSVEQYIETLKHDIFCVYYSVYPDLSI